MKRPKGTKKPIESMPREVQPPDDIKNTARIAKAAQRKHILKRGMLPRPGRPRTAHQPHKIPIVVISDTPAGLEEELGALASALGPRTPGNKRWGRRALYADLLMDSRRLQARGITLPRNKSLSVAALSMGLGNTLRWHGCTDKALETIKKRSFVANKMSRIFGRVSAAVENTPAKIGKP